MLQTGLLALAGLGLLLVVLWWLFIKTEGVYLGRGVVIWLYDLYAPRYERIKGYEAATESYYLARPLLAALAPLTDPLVLDVATGTGRLGRALWRQKDFKGRVIGLDLSRRMLHYAAGRLAQGMEEGRLYLLHAPAEKLPFPDGSFDLVTCLEALEFMTRPHAVIAELTRVARAGGLLVVTNRRGTDAKLMPFKTQSREAAARLYSEKFGWQAVKVTPWQADYDLVWGVKAGASSAIHARPLEAVWLCAACGQAAFRAEGRRAYLCTQCGARVKVGADGVIEKQRG